MALTMSHSTVGIDPMNIETIRTALRGDDQAFEEIIRLYSRPLFSVAYSITQNAAEAEDIVQETFLAAYRNRWRLFNPKKFPAWLTTVARNKARDLWRKRVRQATDGLSEGEGSQLTDHSAPLPSQQIEGSEKERLLRVLLASLPEQWRAAITLRYLEGLDHAAIEERMGLSNGAVRGILGRALARLRDKASAHESEFRN